MVWNRDTLAVILGGGRGTRLAPLTLARAKPAINLAGKFRLIDIPVSNCINSNVMKIFVATQFLSTGLHRHLFSTYRFDRFSEGFVEPLSAEQTPTNTQWFQGTADAIRQSLHYIVEWNIKYVLILSGDHLYSMDYRRILQFHADRNAEVTVSTIPLPEQDVNRMGIMQLDENARIVNFVEKPKDPAVQRQMQSSEQTIASFGIDPAGRKHLGSMGIYVFNKSTLLEMLNNYSHTDFGREVIPEAVRSKRTFAYVYDGYWEDIGTIEAYYHTNLRLTDPLPPFDFYREEWPIYTHPRYLPGVKINGGQVERAILCEGSVVDRAEIHHSIVGIRQMINEGTHIRDSLILGADYYDREDSLEAEKGAPCDIPLGIGRNVTIEHAIIDKNTRIGDGVKIRSWEGRPDEDGDGYYVRSGVVIIPRGGVIRPGREI